MTGPELMDQLIQDYGSKIRPRFSASQEDIREIYDKGRFAKVRFIILALPGNASDEERLAARSRLEHGRARATAGEDFGGLASKHSSFAPQAGRLWENFNEGALGRVVGEIVFGLPIGEISEIFESVAEDYGIALKKSPISRPDRFLAARRIRRAVGTLRKPRFSAPPAGDRCCRCRRGR